MFQPGIGAEQCNHTKSLQIVTINELLAIQMADCDNMQKIMIAYIMRIAVTKTRKAMWRHNGHDDVSNHQPHDCLLNRPFRRR